VLLVTCFVVFWVFCVQLSEFARVPKSSGYHVSPRMIVIACHNEDLSCKRCPVCTLCCSSMIWSRRSGTNLIPTRFPYLLYCKNGSRNPANLGSSQIDLSRLVVLDQNAGRECTSYLRFILDYYDDEPNFPQRVLFLHGHLSSWHNAREFVSAAGSERCFVPFDCLDRLSSCSAAAVLHWIDKVCWELADYCTCLFLWALTVRSCLMPL